MRLTDRDLFLLRVIEKFRVIDIDTAHLFCGFSNIKTTARRLKMLENEKYLKHTKIIDSPFSKHYYLLTQKTMDILFPCEKKVSRKGYIYTKHIKPPTITASNIEHEVACTRMAYKVLSENSELSLDDILSDRDRQKGFYKNKFTSHQCDIEIPKYRIRIEIEITRKSSARLYRNIIINNTNYVQIWVNYSKTVKNKLEQFSIQHPQSLIIAIMVDDLKDTPLELKNLYQQLLIKNKELAEMIEQAQKFKEKREQLSLKL